MKRLSFFHLKGHLKGLSMALYLSLLAPVLAHDMWVEADSEGKMVVRFAEYGEDYEESPGHLDFLSPVTAWTVGAESKAKILETKKLTDGYHILDAKPEQPILVEAEFAVMKRGEGPARKPIFYTRYHQPSFGAAKPSLNFDIVPTSAEGHLQVFFRGKPVSDLKLTVITPDQKELNLQTDAEGKTKFEPSVKGGYLIFAPHHREAISGFSAGKAFDTLSHNSSLFWVQP